MSGSRSVRAAARVAAVAVAAVALAATACTRSNAGGGGPGGEDAGDGGGAGPAGQVACDPGRVTMRRLNRLEYDRTVRDLLGDTSQPARGFPADDIGHGYDNNGDVLATSPLLVEKHLLAVEAMVEAALFAPASEPAATRAQAETVGSGVGAAAGDFWNLWSWGEVAAQFTFSHDAEYAIAVRAYGAQAGDEPARMELRLDGAVIATFDVTATADAPEVYRARTTVAAGTRVVAAAFVNDYWAPEENLDRNLLLDWIEVDGPYGLPPPAPPAARATLIPCDPDRVGALACARTVAAGFARRAWRRPPTDAEIGELVGIFDVAADAGDGFDRGAALALTAILLSPHFFYRVEVDPDPAMTRPRALTDHELAARLAAFLWAGTPDDELLAAADAGALAGPDGPDALERQARRLLADPRADALLHGFAAQWLRTRDLANVAPDYAAFPDWDEALRASLAAETEAFVRDFVLGDRDARELLTARDSYLDGRLARHYGLPAPAGQELVPASLDGGERAGLLGHGSILTVTSYPTRTSIAKRGKWILGQLLCREPPPPPADVDGLVEEVDPTASLRERMERHRSEPRCAGCHAVMDPMGFGLEHFDGVGAWRERDGAFAIDARGELPDGERFAGAGELAALIAADPAFPRCVARHLFVYALGRGPTTADGCALRPLGDDFARAGYRFSDLVVAVVRSDAFRHRGPEAAAEADAEQEDAAP